MSFWTNKQVAFFSERWLAGDTYRQIGDAMAERGWPTRDDVALASKRKALNLPSRWDRANPKPKRAKKERDTFWSEERVAHLREMHANGLTFTQISRRLGRISRNAVIGKARRINLPSRQPSEARHVL